MEDGLIVPRCNYCLFQQILPPAYRQKGVLDKPLPKDHPRRLVIEELCHGDGNDCDMKEAAIRSNHNTRSAYQWELVEILKLDESRRQRREVSWGEAWDIWIDHGSPSSYATRFGLMWDWIEDRMTPTGAYEIIVSEERTFRKALGLRKRLYRERERRMRTN